MNVINKVLNLTQMFYNNCNVFDEGHGFSHIYAVYEHGLNAIVCEKFISNHNAMCILVACILHDIDDNKFFSNSTNAYDIMVKADLDERSIATVLFLISLVPCSKNKNNKSPGFYYNGVYYPPRRWHLIPRWCDRIEAMGLVGYTRAVSYSEHINRPFTSTKYDIKTTLDIEKYATPERFEMYGCTRTSTCSRTSTCTSRDTTISQQTSLLDHYLDKIYHLYVNTENDYLNQKMYVRHMHDRNIIVTLAKTKKV